MNDKPSPPWFGALILSCPALATAWILTYTLSPLPAQNALGGWNYAIVGALLTLFITLSMAWHGDPLDKTRQEARAARTQRSNAGSPTAHQPR
jgi:L-lactate permease